MQELYWFPGIGPNDPSSLGKKATNYPFTASSATECTMVARQHPFVLSSQSADVVHELSGNSAMFVFKYFHVIYAILIF